MSKLFWIIAITILVIGVIGKLIKRESFSRKKESFFNYLFEAGCILFLMLLFQQHQSHKYYDTIVNRERMKYHVPIIHDSMKLIQRSKSEEIWEHKTPYKQDSIQHTRKKVFIGISGIEEEHDFIVNLFEDKALVLKTTYPGFLRSYKTSHQLLDKVELMDRYSTTIKIDLNPNQADSVLRVWALDIYTKEKIFK